jgi:hypothetical protein
MVFCIYILVVCMTTHYTVHFYRPLLAADRWSVKVGDRRGSVKLYLTTDRGSVIVFNNNVAWCVGETLKPISLYLAHGQAQCDLGAKILGITGGLRRTVAGRGKIRLLVN